MRTSANVLLCIIVLTLSACGGGSFEKRLSALDSVLKDKPDSVYELLLGMEEEAAAQNKAGRMYYELLRADAQNKAYVDFTTDSVMKIVADYYDRHGSANEQMRAHYLLGCTYRDLKDVPMELQCFQEAAEKADTTKKDCDLYTLYAIYGQMAKLYHNQYLPEEELQALEMCERTAFLDQDTLYAVTAYQLKTRPYLLLDEKDSVIAITKNALDRYTRIGFRERGARSLLLAINIYIDRHQLQEARGYLELLEKEGNIYDTNGNLRPECTLYLYEKGRLLCMEGEYDKAKECFYRLLGTNNMEGGSKGLLSVYEQTHQIDSIAKYSKMYAAYNDSSFIGVHRDVIEQMTAAYNYTRIQKAKEQVTSQLAVSKSRLALVSNILLLCIVFGITIVYMINLSRKKAIKKIKALNNIIDRDTETLDILKKQQKKDDELYDRLLRDNLVKSEELELLKEEFSNAKKAREEEVCELNNELVLLQEQLSEISQNARMASFYEDETYTIFSTCGVNGTIKIKNSDWAQLLSKFGNVFTKYYDFILQGDSLTQDQIHVCILTDFGQLLL